MSFKLDDSFIKEWSKKVAPFGFNGLGELVYLRTYSRLKKNGENEKWFETIQRVVEGTYNIQKKHIESLNLGWDDFQGQKSAQEMYQRMFEMKFLPPGRGLWSMGTDIVNKGLGASLNNCGFVSTKDIGTVEKFSKSFMFTMDMSMLGVGIGFDTKGTNNFIIQKQDTEQQLIIIEDTREGWVNSLGVLLESYCCGINPLFDYSRIRPLGIPLKTFGGVSSGPQPLIDLHNKVKYVLDKNILKPISTTTIVDIMNLVGKCVVSGNIRRTALISFGESDNYEFMDLKDYSKNPERVEYGWTSNNSIFAKLGMDYSEIAKRICINGEPGIAWLENMQGYSRMCNPMDLKDHRVMGGNPCLEQSLEHSELCCVTFDTRIQTKTGCPKIYSVIDKEIEVWNGEKWSTVIPFLAGKDKEIYRVTLSDGSYLDCTDNHKWSIKGYNKFKEIETKDLKINDRLEQFSLNETINGINDLYAFELGLFAGDGYITENTPMICFCGDKLKLRELTNLNGIWRKEQHPKEYKDPICRFSLKNILDLEICKELNDKKKGLCDYIFTLNKESIYKFVAGYIETDGSLRKHNDSHHYVIFGPELKMRDLQILLRRIDINHATIRLMSPKGFETNKGIRKQDLYSLCIPSYECKEISNYLFIKKADIFSTGEIKNPAHDNSKLISNKSIQKIKKIEKLEIKQDTYCFTEPENHKGVFGNVITHQCLVETFFNRAESKDDFLRTLKFSYLYAKSVTLVNTHCIETNRVQLRNRRIGCSVTGIAQFLSKNSLHNLNDWLRDGYSDIARWDKIYSDWFCIPKSIKMTSVKPSGTISLLAGATPGMHFPESRFYIRRMRLANNSPLIKPLIDAGYFIEPCVGSEDSTSVVEIPIDVGEGIRTVNDVSMWEQLSLAANMQRWWADNQVSCTITFNPETEGKHIAAALDYFQYQLKGISFLPKCNYGAYPQMPYEEINESEYNLKRQQIKQFIIKSMSQDSEGEQFCDGDSCVRH